ncbi:hypothetical protein P691DRAFT_671544 [Macrolepiota fuliginosa MF-IS2]|uniref:Uncharacterized protein n=1 Tax=Macrolepiota fuliginosa MF-IS2 TaxID=1400762 RepID=A0A9P5XCP8_9AGAR|nr:hypothetical protein P691DRAFT_671544 [Macrolepiota fuliginosa MF-IS2]
MAAEAETISVTVTSTNNPPNPATTMSARNTTEFLVRFPPFPPIPDDVEIVSFQEFQERGIRIQPGGEDNETEIDMCGMPTIMLASSHVTDWCKTETKRAKSKNNGKGRKKKKRKTAGNSAGPTSNDWEEYWEEREHSYNVRESYDPTLEPYERFYQGAYDFKNLRPWPLADKQSGPIYVWGEFLRFAGIPLNLDGGAGAKVDNEPSTKEKTDGDSDSDVDDDGDDVMAGILNPNNLVSMDAASKAQAKAEQFLLDPALMLKVFFSSYARDRGIIWTDVNLTGAPILMRFFINFLVENKVLPKREENAIKHESTRRIINVALKELPITSKLAKVWPDEFHRACKGCWGSRAELFVFDIGSPMEGVAGEGGDGEAATATASTNNVENVGPWGTWSSADAPDTTTADTEQGEEGTPDGWSASSGWGAQPDWDSEVVTVGADEEEDMTETRIIEVPAEPDGDNADANADNDGNWNAYKPASLISLLGPTALPITHTTGIVESSMRRIKAVHPPAPDTSKLPVAKDVSAEAVEGILSRTFGVVVLEPWVNWNKGEEPHLAMPKILESSRGAVKTESGETDPGAAGDGTTDTIVAPGALPPFDPHKDGINVLVDPAHLDLLSVGMGCFSTWVQMARVEDLQPQDPKKKKKKNAKMERFWYVEELLRVVPSYYTYLG